MKKIPGYNRYSIDIVGNVFDNKNHRWLKQSNTDSGYKLVTLCGKLWRVHRLVGITYIENPNNKPYINHINCIKTDNRVENLEWCTARENTIHAIVNGKNRTSYKGADNGRCKLTPNDIINIRNTVKERGSITRLVHKYKVSRSTIEKILYNINWKHL